MMKYKYGDYIWVSTTGRSRQAKFIRYHGQNCIVEMCIRSVIGFYLIHERQIIAYDKTKQRSFYKKFVKKHVL